MSKQAKVLTDQDSKCVLAVIAQDRYAERNRALVANDFAHHWDVFN